MNLSAAIREANARGRKSRGPPIFSTLLSSFPVAPERDLASDLAEEIRAAVAAASPAAPPRPAADSSLKEGGDVRVSLTRALEYVTPTIPPAVRLSRSKQLLLRALRFLWRDQTSFNALLIEAGNGLADRIESVRRRLESEIDGERRDIAEWKAESREWKEEASRAAAEHWDRIGRELAERDRRVAIQDGRLWMLEAGEPRSGGRTPPAAAAHAIPAGVYSLFEERFRGSPDEVAAKQRVYLPFLRDLPGPVLDVGCGRGELLGLLAAEGIPASGVEINPIAAAACREAGLDVAEGDGLAALSARPPGSLGAVLALQVVEHWDAATTFAFLGQSRRAIAPGGVLIAETVNTDSLSALKAFFLDPSHVRPVPADALRFLAEVAGFVETRIEYSAQLPDETRLEESTSNDAKLNRLLFGPQDYAVIARVPPGA
jgi:SAM-dependent methyltransferase